jgi:predicted nucleotidyltransferase
MIYMEAANIPQRYQNDIELAVNFLKSEGCSAVYLFGSLVTGKAHDDSDIDIGVKGLPPKKFIRTFSVLNDKLSNKIDLVDWKAGSIFRFSDRGMDPASIINFLSNEDTQELAPGCLHFDLNVSFFELLKSLGEVAEIG